MDAHLIYDVPATGTWNMAMDEALLEWAEKTGETCLRFYQWSPATLSQPRRSFSATSAGGKVIFGGGQA